MSRKYMFLEDSDKLVSKISERFLSKGQYRGDVSGKTSEVFEKVKKSYNYYHGRHYVDSTAASGVGRAGEQGEYAAQTTNHFRTLISTQFSMLTQEEIVFDSQAENTNVQTKNSTVVSNIVLDQYFSEKNFGEKCKDMLELGLYTGTVYAYQHWDIDEGQPIAVKDGVLIKEGEAKLEILNIFDVIVEPWQDKWEDQQWCIVRKMVNRHDLVDIFPDYEDEILKAPEIDDIRDFDPYYNHNNEDYIFLYRMYHKHTHALPEGRQTWFLEDHTILFDELSSPYEELPVYKFVPSKIPGSNYGHCVGFDLLPIQEALNILESAILTNQENFAVQNITAPRSMGLSVSQLNGMNLIEFDDDFDGKGADMIKPLQLLHTPAEVFQKSKDYVTAMEQISGINDIVRGKAGANVTSGTMAAVLASAAG